MRGEGCGSGQVRVVITRAGRETVKIDTYAGPLHVDPVAGQDLGVVPAREAASYLMNLASTLDGRPAREAVLPAMLADSAQVTPVLLQLARDQSRPRDLRRSAISWASRRRAEAGGVGAAAVAQTLDAESDQWLSKQAYSSLARSGDPRARQFVRATVQRTGMPEETRASLIHGLGDDGRSRCWRSSTTRASATGSRDWSSGSWDVGVSAIRWRWPERAEMELPARTLQASGT